MKHGLKHVVWDWNGTLLDDLAFSIQIMNTLLSRRGLAMLSRERYQELFDFPVIEYYRRLGLEALGEPFERVGAEFMGLYEAGRNGCGLHVGVGAVLGELGGVGQHVLSAYKQSTLEEALRHYGLDGFFGQVVGHGDIYAGSKVENGRALLQRLGVAGAEVLVVGDTVHDWEVACDLGAPCVLVACGHHGRGKLERCGVPVLAGPWELPAWLGVQEPDTESPPERA